jgi:hypothetical protein
MKIVAPERCWGYLVAPTGAQAYMLGTFDDTSRVVDVPDYFHQVTSGNAINDVVHAKVVDHNGKAYTKWDQFIIDSYGRKFPYVQYSGSLLNTSTQGTSSVLNLCKYTVLDEHRTVRGQQKTFYKKKFWPISFEIFVGGASGTTQNADHYIYGTITAYVCDPMYPPRGGPNGLRTLRKYIWNFRTVTEYRYPRQYWSSISVKAGTSMGSLTPADLEDPFVKPLYEAFCKNLFQRGFRTISEMTLDLEPRLSAIIQAFDPELIYSKVLVHGSVSWGDVGCYQTTDKPIPVVTPKEGFILSEIDLIGYKLDPLIVASNKASNVYVFEYLVQHAMLAALQNLPSLSDNTIQNIIEIVSFIKSAVVDKKVEMPRSLQDAWLAYRYTYGTGKMDVEEAVRFFTRRRDLGTLDRLIAGKGTSNYVMKDGTEVVCRCSVEVTPKNLGYLKKIWRALDMYGLTPDFYVIWDSIPYSFMVDWFIPVGNMLSVVDANNMYFSGEFYTLDNVCYSLKYTRELGDTKVQCYTRWKGSVPRELNSIYWFEPSSLSTKTWAKRILDAGSIFIGN